MQLRMLRAKLHLATITAAALHYHGSITLAEDLMEAVGLLPYEAVTVANLSTGDRAETYAIAGPRGSGMVQMNGAMARLAAVGDRVIIMSFAFLHPAEVASHRPRIAVLNERNAVVEQWEG